jgi:hypothetical protein
LVDVIGLFDAHPNMVLHLFSSERKISSAFGYRELGAQHAPS